MEWHDSHSLLKTKKNDQSNWDFQYDEMKKKCVNLNKSSKLRGKDFKVYNYKVCEKMLQELSEQTFNPWSLKRTILGINTCQS